MTLNAILTVGLLCLAAVICIVGFSVFVKRQRNMAAISERVCSLDIPGVTVPQIAISIPAEWRYNRIDGPGFYVHSFRSADDTGDIAAYVGHNPSLRKEVTSRKRVGHVGGKKVEFCSATTDGTTIFQAVVKGFFAEYSDNTTSALILHIMIVARERGFAKKAFRALKTLHLVE